MKLLLFIFLLIIPSSIVISAQEINLSAKAGGFIFTSDEPGLYDYWAKTGLVIGGRISYKFIGTNVLSLDIEDIKSEKGAFLEGYSYNSKSQILSVLVLYEKRLLKNTIIVPYLGGGFGITILSLDASISDYGYDDSKTDFAYKSFIGFNLGKYLFLEAGYLSGDRNGNTGISITGGYKIFIN